MLASTGQSQGTAESDKDACARRQDSSTESDIWNYDLVWKSPQG